MTLDEARGHLSASTPAKLEILLDVKEPGAEAAISHALTAARLLPRAAACAREADTLRRLGAAEPGLRRLWSLKGPRHAAAARLGGPRRDVAVAAGAAVRAGLAEGVTVHASLATARLVELVHGVGGHVVVWGIQRPVAAARLAALGVDG